MADVRIRSASNDDGVYREALVSRLKKQAANRFCEPVPGGFMHCTANVKSGDDLSLAECNKLAAAGKSPFEIQQTGRSSTISLGHSGISPCMQCVFGVAFTSNQKTAKAKIEAMAANIDTAPHKVAAQVRREQFERALKGYRSAEAAVKKA